MPDQAPPLYSRLTRATTDPEAMVGLLDEVAALDPEKDAHELDDCMSALTRSPELSVLALGNWLGANAKLPVAKLLVHELSVQYLAAKSLVDLNLATLHSSAAVLVAFRLCALATTPAFSLGWVLGLFRDDETGVQTNALELLRYHISEYPHTTQRLLEPLVPELTATLPVVAEVLSMLSAQAVAFEQAPRLKEFAMSREERIALQGLKLREQREIHRHAEQSSVLMQFVKQSHFKYSRETVVEFSAQGQTFEQSLSMQPHAVSVELPISERLDPQTGPRRRRLMWAGPPS